MSQLWYLLRFVSGRAARRNALVRRRRLALESLEGRALLTIDFASAFSLGSDSINLGRIARDDQGDTYVTGSFTGAVDFGNGSPNNVGGTTTAFIAKYSPTNALLWVKQFGVQSGVTTDQSQGSAVAVDHNTNSVYVVGIFKGPVDFDPGGGTDILTSNADSADGFIVKLTSNGDLSRVETFGGNKDDVARELVLSPDGTNVYVTGSFAGTVDFNPGGTGGSLTGAVPPATDTFQPNSDTFALKLTSDLSFGWVGSVNLYNSAGNDIAVDGQGDVYVTGTQEFVSFIGTYYGKAFVTHFSSGGALLGTISFGNLPASNISGANASAVVTDSTNHVYVVGSFLDPGFNLNSPGTSTPALDASGHTNAFLIKLDSTLNLVWARRFGPVTSGSRDALGNDLAIDASNNLYMTGLVAGPASFGTTGPGIIVLDTGTGISGYVLKVDGNGNFVQSIGTGGTGIPVPSAIAVNGSGGIAISGLYFLQNPSDSVTFGSTSLTSTGKSNQVFLAILNDSTPTTPTPTTPTPTTPTPTTPTPTPPPTFTGEHRLFAGKGRRRKIVGFQLDFSTALNASVAQNGGLYRVVQPGRNRRSAPKVIPVKSAQYNAGTHSITLTLGKYNSAKPLQLTVTGLVGATDTPASTIVTQL